MTEQSQVIRNRKLGFLSDDDNNVVDPKKVKRYVLSASSGTALEYFDFAIYGLATALIFNPLFFPNISPMAGFLASFATYAIGFFARAVGGVVLGYYGDRLGRKFVLVLTIGLMGGATVGIGLLPTFNQIGIWAPILLVLLRIAQGFGAGAEIAGAQTMLAEVSPRNRRGLISSFVSFGTNLGTIVALGLWLFISKLPEESLLSWGWRIPFLASVLVVAYTLWMRHHLEESPTFTANEHRQETIAFGPYMKDLLTNGRRSLLRSVGLRIGESGPSSFYQVFLIGYIANVLHFDKSLATNALLLTSFALFVIIPLVGILCDKFGRRTMYLIFTGWSMIWCLPAIWMVSTGDSSWILLAFFGGYGIGVVGTYVVQLAYMPELYGSRYRNGGLAASKEFGGMISGGLVPFVCAGIAALTDSVLPIAGYIILLAAVAFVTALKSPETKGRDLFLEEDA